MKKVTKKAIFIIIILILLFSIHTNVFALGEVIQDGDSFLAAADGSGGAGSIGQGGELKELSGFLYNTLLSAGVIIAVIVATILGIQFMLGGAEGQAKVKEMLIPFVVGCIIVFGGFGIWKIALTFGQNMENGGISSGSSSGASSESSGGLSGDIDPAGQGGIDDKNPEYVQFN